ncbi:hypothetical protein WJX72_006780 [[Myrmecia] bisecta]|uniref:Uncharacterized protein n=1 Tax=[Myrmecia] bisecta TaxID=41462 RepID=A0AAW1PUG1_9CHLO
MGSAQQPPSAADIAARAKAAEAAAAREAAFRSSPGGRAAHKAVDNVKKEREAERQSRQDNARDWLT